MIAALIALALFPFTIPLIVRAAGAFDGVTLLAAYHTAYNVVGVAVLMPVIGWFTRFVERLLPDRTSPLTRCSRSRGARDPDRGRRSGAADGCARGRIDMRIRGCGAGAPHPPAEPPLPRKAPHP